MNLSLKNRVTASFIIANLVVLVLSFTVFHFLNALNQDIEKITLRANKEVRLTDDIRIIAVSILKYQRRILVNKPTPELVEKIINLCESFISQLHRLDALYTDADVKKIITQMKTYVESLKLVLSKSSLFYRDTVGMSTIGDLADKILESFSEFQDLQFKQNVSRDKQISGIVKGTKSNMMITLIIGFMGTIILGLVIPGKIALPFKKIKDAIRELQDCNFDVSIYYSQDDEIGEIAREMNKMIHSVKKFEELRSDRISVENRKFDALANLVKKPILVANADGKLIYMNNKLYSLLQVQSEDVIGKIMRETVVPETIIDTYELAIKRRSKIENAEIKILNKHEEETHHDAEHTPSEGVEVVDVEEAQEEAPILDYIFKGYATVIPIRGKESSLDYYLMVLSSEVVA